MASHEHLGASLGAQPPQLFAGFNVCYKLKRNAPQMFFCQLERNHDPFKKTQQFVKNLSPGKRSVFQYFLNTPAPCSLVEAAVGGAPAGPGDLLLFSYQPGLQRYIPSKLRYLVFYSGAGRLARGGLCVCVYVLFVQREQKI